MDMLNSWWGGGSAEQKKEVNSKDDSGSVVEKDSQSTDDDVAVVVDVVKDDDDQTSKSVQQPLPNKEEGEEQDVSTEAAITAAKEWGSYLYNFAKEGTKIVAEQATKTASVIKSTVEEKTIVGAFNKEQEKFVKEKHSKRTEAAVPPWVGYNEEDTMKEQIMALSQEGPTDHHQEHALVAPLDQMDLGEPFLAAFPCARLGIEMSLKSEVGIVDKRNFLRNPPAGVQFNFEFQNMFPIAMATLQEDNRLEKMRFDLVPKQISEENFWRNYFYRVSLIKQSSQLTSLATSSSGELNSKTDSNGKKSSKESESEERKDKSASVLIPATQSASKTSEDLNLPPDSPPATEFASDAFNSELDQEDLQKGMEQLGMDKKDGKENKDSNEDDVPEWEKELQQELQDYEVVDEEVEGNEEWEREIDQMLEDEVQEEGK